MRTTLLAMLLCLPLAALHGAGPGADPSWLLGCWQSDDGREVEAWASESDGSMIGFGVSLAGSEVAFHELLSIRRTNGGGLVYTAHPAGQARTAFHSVEVGAGHLRFRNPDHDFPQEIAYRLDGERLLATISALDGVNPRIFVKRRCD